MELYLVKEHVKITQVSEAFSKSKEHNAYAKEVKLEQQEGNCNADSSNEDSYSQDDEDRTILTLSGLPVTFGSICSDANKHSENFTERVEMKLTKERNNFEWENIKLELVISKDPNSLNGYFVLSAKFPEGSKTNVFQRLYEELDTVDYLIEYSVEVSLCHLPTNNAAVRSESSVILKSEEVYFDPKQYRVDNITPVAVPPEMKDWWEQGTGFIYSKVSVKVTLDSDSVNRAYGYSFINESLLENKRFADVEIRCKSGEILQCHRAILAADCTFFRDKFEEMVRREKKIGPWKLEMEMGREGVEAFLAYIYCGNVSGGLRQCDTALELFKAGGEYEICGLRDAMEEIILAKGSSDFEYFSVKSALELFLFARNVENLKHLRDKAVRVLRNYLKTASDKILESKEYQDLFQNQQRVAMELSTLCIQLAYTK